MADEPEEEKTYEVKDKRRFNPDGTPREGAEAAEEAESRPEPEETAEGEQELGSQCPRPTCMRCSDS